jgi:hypothetical protein
MLAGNVVALLSPVLFISVLTLIFGVGKSFHLCSFLRRLTCTKTTMTGCQ